MKRLRSVMIGIMTLFFLTGAVHAEGDVDHSAAGADPDLESLMSEYIDTMTDFRIEYPSVFVFTENGSGAYAVTADGKSSLSIDSMVNDGMLDETSLINAIRLEIPDAELRRSDLKGIYRFDRSLEDSRTIRTDIWFLNEASFHHMILTYPAEETDVYDSYIEYMIHSIGSTKPDLG